MAYEDINEKNSSQFNMTVNHPLQSYEWGEFRKKTGIKVIRKILIKEGKTIDGFTLTLHKVPKLNFFIGYLPKGNYPTKTLLDELKKIGKEQNCIFIQLEPNVIKKTKPDIKNKSLRKSFHPLFTKYTFVLDLMKGEEELLKSFHPKTRYNIKVANKHGVKVKINNSNDAFNEYLRLTEETTSRQRFFAHTPDYHKKMWETLKGSDDNKNKLTAYLMTAEFEKKTLSSWILFTFHDTLYYPYGASSSENRNVMASNLIMWEAILFGKKMGLKKFDMWGALDPKPDKNNPWYGFHKFKEGYGAELTEFVGSYDLVVNPFLYQAYKAADKIRWLYLRAKRQR